MIVRGSPAPACPRWAHGRRQAPIPTCLRRWSNQLGKVGTMVISVAATSSVDAIAGDLRARPFSGDAGPDAHVPTLCRTEESRHEQE